MPITLPGRGASSFIDLNPLLTFFQEAPRLTGAEKEEGPC
jgi:hypothetical protein